MKSVEKVLRTKGSETWHIAPQATVYEALQLMSEKEIGSILVLEEGEVVGIFTERDYARKLILKGKF